MTHISEEQSSFDQRFGHICGTLLGLPLQVDVDFLRIAANCAHAGTFKVIEHTGSGRCALFLWAEISEENFFRFLNGRGIPRYAYEFFEGDHVLMLFVSSVRFSPIELKSHVKAIIGGRTFSVIRRRGR